MRKFFAALVLLLICFNCANSSAEDVEKFVNPVFYKTMKPFSNNSWKTQITPTQIIETNIEDYSVKYDCKLLKNTKIMVEMLCSYYNPLVEDTVEDIIAYVIQKPHDDPDFWKNYILIERRSKSKGEDHWSSYEHLVIVLDASKK